MQSPKRRLKPSRCIVTRIFSIAHVSPSPQRPNSLSLSLYNALTGTSQSLPTNSSRQQNSTSIHFTYHQNRPKQNKKKKRPKTNQTPNHQPNKPNRKRRADKTKLKHRPGTSINRKEHSTLPRSSAPVLTKQNAHVKSRTSLSLSLSLSLSETIFSTPDIAGCFGGGNDEEGAGLVSLSLTKKEEEAFSLYLRLGVRLLSLSTYGERRR